MFFGIILKKMGKQINIHELFGISKSSKNGIIYYVYGSIKNMEANNFQNIYYLFGSIYGEILRNR